MIIFLHINNINYYIINFKGGSSTSDLYAYNSAHTIYYSIGPKSLNLFNIDSKAITLLCISVIIPIFIVCSFVFYSLEHIRSDRFTSSSRICVRSTHLRPSQITLLKSSPP